jgi:hypothetical protein
VFVVFDRRVHFQAEVAAPLQLVGASEDGEVCPSGPSSEEARGSKRVAAAEEKVRFETRIRLGDLLL